MPKGVAFVDRASGNVMDSSLPPDAHDPELMPFTRRELKRQQAARRAAGWQRGASGWMPQQALHQPFAGLSSNRG